MFPFLDIARAILALIPDMMFNPMSPRFFLFWLFVLAVSLQYRRIAANEQRLLGQVKNRPFPQTVHAVVQGLLAGIAGSFLLVFVGVTFTPGAQLGYLILLAMLLMLVSPRLICLAYAGGLASLSSLAFGFPAVDVAALMAMVAILHLMESLLITLTGFRTATPAFIRTQRREVVGGFSLQRFWPIPFVVLLLGAAPREIVDQGIRMPEWWPLIPVAPRLLEDPAMMFQMLPVIAVMGYGDLAVSRSPVQRSRETGKYLALYSLVLLGLALLGGRHALFLWSAAIAAIVGHELVVRRGGRAELGRPAWLKSLPGQLTILDVMPGLPADRAGLRTGDVVRTVNGHAVGSRTEFSSALEQAGPVIELGLERLGGPVTVIIAGPIWTDRRLGLLLAPEPGDLPQMEIGRPGILAAFVRRLLGRRR
ncbi:MAG TPA: PDZ domain-containing protein [Bacillota bacterium]|nr:PDZ domain-containing protein [Bacillota bacterium]